MIYKKIGTVKIFGIDVNKFSYNSFLQIIKEGIDNNKKLSIAYANVNSLNKIYEDAELKQIYNSFDYIHPDGIGVYIASKILHGKNGLQERITGSDFYNYLVVESVKNNWSLFFFGHRQDILDEIQNAHPLIKISGTQEGYDFENPKILDKINSLNSDIIIIGLSCPIQEKWMYHHKNDLNFKVMLSVGDGIKIFANKKIRGPVFMRKIGLEWFVRYCMNPVSNFRKYIIGNPLFLYRIYKGKSKSG